MNTLVNNQFDLVSAKLNWLDTADYAFCIKEKVDDMFIMRELNQAYERTYLTPNGKRKEDYIDKNCIDVWGDEIGKIYQNNDLEVYNSKSSKRFSERVKVGDKEYYRRFQKKYFKNQLTQREYIILWSIDIDN